MGGSGNRRRVKPSIEDLFLTPAHIVGFHRDSAAGKWRLVIRGRMCQLDRQSLAVQSVGVLIGRSLFIVGKLPDR